MEETSAQRFLRMMNEQNNAIAARAAAQAKAAEPDLDPFRLKTDQERRDKWGQLRARPHPRAYQRATKVLPHVDLS